LLELSLRSSAVAFDGHTNVQFGDGDVKAHIGELVHRLTDVLGLLSGCCVSGRGWIVLLLSTDITYNLVTDKVTLKTDAMQRLALVQQLFGDGSVSLGLVVDRLDVVVVDVELDVWGRGVGVVKLCASQSYSGSPASWLPMII
jgi:hypothetical protein